MAKVISYFLMANSQNVVSANGGMNQQLTGPIIVLRPKYIPSEYSFSVVLGINGFEKTSNNQIRIEIISPTDKQVIDTGYIDLPDLDSDSALPIPYRGFSLTLPVQNAILESEGLYRLNVYVNEDKLIFDQEIPVFLQEDTTNGLRNNND